MTTEQQNKLERLRHYRTAYELFIESHDGKKYLVCYTSGLSRSNILHALTRKLEAGDTRLARMQTVSGCQNWTFENRAKGGKSENGWALAIGRTEREAISQGELPYLSAPTPAGHKPL